jgi:hypothetical protein
MKKFGTKFTTRHIGMDPYGKKKDSAFGKTLHRKDAINFRRNRSVVNSFLKSLKTVTS